MNSKTVLFIDTVHSCLQEALEPAGFECVDASEWSLDKIHEHIASATGIVIRSRIKIDSGFLSKAKNLKFIARAGAGMENIDLPVAESMGIHCINAPEGNRDAVGEHALGMLLVLMNKLFIADQEVRNGVWRREENRGHEIKGKSIAIIGFGNNGSAFAKKISGFDAHEILAFDPYIQIDNSSYPYVRQTMMDEIFQKCDIISFHVPLTPETLFLVNDYYLSRFKKPIYLINVARGKILQTEALVKAIESGKVIGAGLDVFEYESSSFEALSREESPVAYNYLLNSNKVMLTPHIGGWSVESHKRISEILAQKILSIY